jgi:serine/threonine protein kinase
MDYFVSLLQSVGLVKPDPPPVFPGAVRRRDNSNNGGKTELTDYYWVPPMPNERYADAYPLSSEIHILGQGSFGTVRLVKLKTDTNRPPIEYACKTIPKTKTKDGTDYVNRTILQEEVYNICRCQGHQNIVKLLDVFEDKRNVHLIMEVCKGGELYSKVLEAKRKRQKVYRENRNNNNDGGDGGSGNAIEASGGLDEGVAVKIVYQILSAICYCQDRFVVHRDLKASNFLFKSKEPAGSLGGTYSLSLRWIVRIIDFGLSKYVPPPSLLRTADAAASSDNDDNDQNDDTPAAGATAAAAKSTEKTVETTTSVDSSSHDDDLCTNDCGYMTSEVGTPYYTAPEVLTQDEYNSKCDCWSVGAIAYLLLSGELPVLGKDERETVKMLMDMNLTVKFDTSPTGVWRDDGPISSHAREFCQALLQKDPKSRPTAREALHFKWMTQHHGVPREAPTPVLIKNEDIVIPFLSKTDNTCNDDPGVDTSTCF